MMYLIFFVVLAIYRGIITWKFYVAADRKAWEAFVPFYNTWVLLKITERPKWWIAIYYVPVVDNVMAIIITYELLHMFKFREVKHTIYSVLTLGLYLAYLNYTAKLKYSTRDDSWIKKNLGTTVNAVLFAVVAATLIRSTTFESYTIPTGSMEESMKVGDFLFVSKMHYGVRLPITPFTVPLMHNNIYRRNGLDGRTPESMVKSYVDFLQLPYVRLPKFTDVQNNDPVVFNWPVDPYHEPIDKKENYVKRCKGVPGDTLMSIDRELFVNGAPETLPDRARRQFSYKVVFSSPLPRHEQLLNFDVDVDFSSQGALSTSPDIKGLKPLNNGTYEFTIIIPDDQLEAFSQLSNLISIEPVNASYDVNNLPHDGNGILGRFFPNDPTLVQELGGYINWTFDNFPKFWVPEEGGTIELNELNYRIYSHVIENYEGHDIAYNNGVYTLDGREVTSYTFQQNYYWMMGDNRHNSEDSRMWGFVPETNIVGKPVFIWMSYDSRAEGIDKLRTDRLFTTVNGTGERFSYFLPFIGVVIVWNIVARIRKRKKTAKA